MISHHHKCIFVHIPKTAGQSIEHIFLDDLGLTWETRAPLLLRPNNRPELGPPRLAHLKATDYVRLRYVPKEMFEGYFKFSFVRNPWSRAVSLYKFLGYHRRINFKSFLFNELRDRLMKEENWFVGPQYKFIYSDEGRLLVDYVGRFENLQTDFNTLCNRIGITPKKLPHVNRTDMQPVSQSRNMWSLLGGLLPYFIKKRTDHHGCWRDFYDHESVECVSRIYEKDIEIFSYDF